MNSMSGYSRFDCYPSDFLNGLIGMTADEIAAYVVIIMLQYDRGDPVKYEGRERELSVRAGMPRGRLSKAVAGLLDSGKLELAQGCLHNRRAAKEISKISEKISKNRENSARGGEVTKKKFEEKSNVINLREGPSGQPSGQPFDSPILLPSTLSLKKEDICPKPVRTQYGDDFENFWEKYPKDSNMSKKKAAEVWRKLCSEDRELAAFSLTGFRAYCESHPDYRAVHAEKYLRDRRFEGHAQSSRKLTSQVFVRHGTPAWSAWERFKGKALPTMKNQSGPGDGWLFPSEFPPAKIMGERNQSAADA